MPLDFSIQIVAAICTCHFVSPTLYRYRTCHSNGNLLRYLTVSIKAGTKILSVRKKDHGIYSCTAYFYFFIFSLDVVFIIIVCYLFIMVNCMIWHISIQHIHTKYFLPCPFPSHYLILLLLFPFSLGINVTGCPEKKRLAWTILNESVYLAFNNNTLVAEVSAESLQLITLNKANTSTTSCIPWAI